MNSWGQQSWTYAASSFSKIFLEDVETSGFLESKIFISNLCAGEGAIASLEFSCCKRLVIIEASLGKPADVFPVQHS